MNDLINRLSFQCDVLKSELQDERNLGLALLADAKEWQKQYSQVCIERDDVRAALTQQTELVEKCMVAMNENADLGQKAERERDQLAAKLAALEGQPMLIGTTCT